jgi:hypothetical protein
MLEALGVDVSGKGHTTPQVLPIWQAAKETVDGKLVQLQRAMTQTKHPDMIRLAQSGINGFTGRNCVTLMAALHEADASGASGHAKLGSAVQSFKSFLDSSKSVALIDSNPFGVSIGLKETLGRALGDIEKQIST